MIVDANPLIARGVAKSEIDFLTGLHTRAVDVDHMHPEAVRSGQALHDILPAVATPTHAGGCAQRDDERGAHGKLGDRCMLAPERTRRLAAFAVIALPRRGR